jgi:hypothetical protein
MKNNKSLIIEKEEIPYFEYLGQILDNQTILEACNKFNSESKHEITFSSSHLKHVHRKQKSLLRDFSLIVNGITFQVNYSLFCSVCDKFYETGRQITEFVISIPEQFFQCFESFIKIFDGQEFYFSSFSLDSLIFLIDLFKISCLIPFLHSQIQIPKTIQDSISFLSLSKANFFEGFKWHFESSYNILLKNFSTKLVEQFNQLSNSQLLYLFSMKELKLKDENQLFKIVFELIQLDQNRIELMKVIKIEFVSSDLLLQFLQNMILSEINEELFSIFKKRLVCDIFQPNEENLSNRWINQPKLISLSELEEIQKILQTHFSIGGSLKEQISLLISEIETLHLKLSKSEQEISSLEQENHQNQMKIHSLEHENQQMHSILQKLPLYASFESKFEEWIGKKKWNLLYKGSRDGFQAFQFHSKCDKKGATVTIIKSQNGYLFGGFTPLNWESFGNWYKDDSKQSFIFTLINPHNIEPTQYQLIEPEKAIFCFSNYGRTFGDFDIHISFQNSNSFHFKSYSDTTGKGENTFTGNEYFQVDEIEVYQISS